MVQVTWAERGRRSWARGSPRVSPPWLPSPAPCGRGPLQSTGTQADASPMDCSAEGALGSKSQPSIVFQ